VPRKSNLTEMRWRERTERFWNERFAEPWQQHR